MYNIINRDVKPSNFAVGRTPQVSLSHDNDLHHDHGNDTDGDYHDDNGNDTDDDHHHDDGYDEEKMDRLDAADAGNAIFQTMIYI